MNNKKIEKVSNDFDFSRVPSWYVLCTNNECPLKAECLRYLAGKNAPDSLEIATRVMPQTLKNGKCRWFDKITIDIWAAGFSHLYDKVMKKDYTVMRKTITKYLNGCKFYYAYKRGDRALTSEQQQWIRNFVKSYGYDWEVEYDRYFEEYVYHHLPILNK